MIDAVLWGEHRYVHRHSPNLIHGGISRFDFISDLGRNSQIFSDANFYLLCHAGLDIVDPLPHACAVYS